MLPLAANCVRVTADTWSKFGCVACAALCVEILSQHNRPTTKILIQQILGDFNLVAEWLGSGIGSPVSSTILVSSGSAFLVLVSSNSKVVTSCFVLEKIMKKLGSF